MKKLGSKVNLWFVVVFLALISNSIFDIFTLRQLSGRDAALNQSYDLAVRVRQLREAFFQYHNYALISVVTKDAHDISLRDQSRRILIEAIDSGLPEDVDPEIRIEFDDVANRINQMLILQPKQGSIIAVPNSIILNHEYRIRYAEAFEKIEGLSRHSSDLVKNEEAKAHGFIKNRVLLNTIVLIYSVIALLLAFWFFRNRILMPLSKLITMVTKIKHGDLGARVEINGTGELAEMGQVLNEATEELQLKREERIKFIGSVAHDIRSPLTVMSMTCDLALRQLNRNSPVEMYEKTFNRLQTQVGRIQQMVEDLLEAAKAGMPNWSLAPTELRLGEILLEVVEMFRVSSHRTIDLIEESGSGSFEGDRNRMIQVITNLISNALKYSPPTTKVEVVHGVANDQVYFEVRDFGPGISKNQREVIFKPFTRLHSGLEVTEGTGLGLTIAREIIEAHHGNITVKEREGGGSIFRVTLPLTKSAIVPGLRRSELIASERVDSQLQ